MVRRGTEVRFEEWLAGWLRKRLPCRLQRHKHGVNFFQYFGIFKLHGPAMLCLVVIEEDPQTVGYLAVQVVAVAPPRRIYKLPIGGALSGQVERIKDE